MSYFIHKNEFNTKIMKHISASERWCGRWDLNPQGNIIHRSLRPARLPVPPHPHKLKNALYFFTRRGQPRQSLLFRYNLTFSTQSATLKWLQYYNITPFSKCQLNMYIKIKNMFSYIQLVNSFNIISTTSLTVISFEIIFSLSNCNKSFSFYQRFISCSV